MFMFLLVVTLAMSLLTSWTLERAFRKPLAKILGRIVSEDLAPAWQRYVRFAIYVVGVSGGVRVWDLEKYITPDSGEADAVILNAGRWTLEVYRTIIGTLQSVAWMLLVFFLFALIAYVLVRNAEMKRNSAERQDR